MKRVLVFMLMLGLLVAPVTAFAAQSDRSYSFELTSNGRSEVYADQGDILTVTLTLRRTDEGSAAVMYGVQDEIRYDDDFLRIVPESFLLADKIETTDIALQGGDRALYLNFLSLGGGEEWKPNVIMGSFQVEIIAEHGSTVLKNENCIVSTEDGQDSYALEVQDLRIIVSSDCIVKFDLLNGNEVVEQVVKIGSKLERPEDPIREGYEFTGWYKDVNLTQLWDFEGELVDGNLTLYAGWKTAAGADAVEQTNDDNCWIYAFAIAALLLIILIILLLRKTVKFDSCGGTPVETVKVFYGKKLNEPAAPMKENAVFVGWYLSPDGVDFWSFDQNIVKKNITLYAHWK